MSKIFDLPRIFIDMDGVVVDFEDYKNTIESSWKKLHPETEPPKIKTMEGAYTNMQPIPGALESVRSLIGMGFDVWFATKPPTGRKATHAYTDKVNWVWLHIPELGNKVILTQNKGLLGNHEDHLIDDRPHKADCRAFSGTLHEFTKDNSWPEILQKFKDLRLYYKIKQQTMFSL